MKKFLSIVLLAFAMQASAQTNPITSITISLPANPDANTANWGTGTSQLTITAASQLVNGKVNGLVVESKILVIIKKNGAKICGSYTSGNAPASGFNTATKVWSGSNAASLIGEGCSLKPGEYELSVQFFGYRGAAVMPLSEERTKPFTIRGNEQQTYREPQGIAPGNGTTFNEGDIKKPITFRWTPVVPKPQESTTYRLRVWQLMEGQNTQQARTVNQPIFTKDVDNLTQAIAINLITGPCKPPYLCSFIWNVQALNREGKPIGENNGTSELFSFKYDTGPSTTNDDVKKSLSLVSPADGSVIDTASRPLFNWAADNLQTQTYKIKIVEIKGDQSPEVALRTNKPIFEKDSLKDLLFHYPVFGPRMIPGGKYAWGVQANGRNGKPDGEAKSNTFSFSIASGGCVGKLTLKSVTCGDYGPAGFKYNVCVNYTSDPGNTCNIAYNDAQNATLNALTGHNLANIIKDASGGTVSNITFAPSPSSTIAPGQSTQVCFTLTSNQPNATIVTYGLCKDGKELIAPNFANDVLIIDLKACTCTYCNEIDKWKFDTESVTATSEAPFLVNLSTTITSPEVSITNFKAELVSFTQDGKQQACFGCNTDAQTFGNFTGGTFGAWGNGTFPLYGSNTTHHTLSWFSANGSTTALAGSAINIAFTAPPLNPLNCCDDEISFCIRYSFTDKECRTCSFVKCYTVTRKHK
jgi:hypothetical protein